MNRRIIDYCTVDSVDSNDLVTVVKGLMEKGWQPQGGVVVSNGNDEYYRIFAQALVKYEYEDDSVSVLTKEEITRSLDAFNDTIPDKPPF